MNNVILLSAVALSAGCLRSPDLASDDSEASGVDASSTSEPGETSTGDPSCGNSVVDPGEGCDDSNDADDDECPSGPVGQCKAAAACGDGIVWTGQEECDGGEGCDNCILTPAECGNKVIEAGEACDDGNTEDADECPSGAVGKCLAAGRCGDGITWAGVEVCDDGNTEETDACPSGAEGQCLAEASCGDGFVWAGEEACDDGNADDTDVCPSGMGACQAEATCGDGYVRAGVEDCDDQNAEDLDECNNSCWTPRWVFVTSINGYNGNLGGVAGADASCQMLAETAGLPGQYMAWLTGSNPASAPAMRFGSTEFKGWYFLPPTDMPTPVALGWTDLITPEDDMPSNHLKSAIHLNESGIDIIDGSVWSNTTPQGTQKSATTNCGDWMSGANGDLGQVGLAEASTLGVKWTDDDMIKCNAGSRLYCFQVN